MIIPTVAYMTFQASVLALLPCACLLGLMALLTLLIEWL